MALGRAGSCPCQAWRGPCRGEHVPSALPPQPPLCRTVCAGPRSVALLHGALWRCDGARGHGIPELWAGSQGRSNNGCQTWGARGAFPRVSRELSADPAGRAAAAGPWCRFGPSAPAPRGSIRAARCPGVTHLPAVHEGLSVKISDVFGKQALGSFYFLHESLKNIYQFDFKAKKYKKVTGKEIYSDTLESTPMLEKEKFPQDYFPECKWSRKGFIRTRWCITDCAFDLVNIHLFHDASNLIAWETSPSVYSGIRHKALGYVLDRIIDQRFEKVSYFVFGDFNFRLDAKAVVETLCAKATMQTVRAADTNEVVKLIFRESDNDRKVMLQLEKKLFDYFNQDVFRDNNGTALLEFDRELSVFKDRLYELDISFPPSYPYSEDSSQGKQYMNTRCPAWCDRILMSHSAKELILKSENDEKIVIYDHIGPNVCMGDHKPVFLSFRIAAGAGKPIANVHKCCVVQ